MVQAQFITELKYIRNVSPKTLGLYGWAFKAFEGALDSKEAVIKRIVELRDRGVSTVTVNTYLRCINAYFNWQHHEAIVGERIRIPKLKEEQKVLLTLSPNQIATLISFKPTGINQKRAHIVACTILDCGLRISEVLSLRCDDVDVENLCLKVKGKGSKERIVPISLELRKLLFRWLRTSKGLLVFGTRNGTQLTNRNAERDLKELCRKARITGVRCSPHTLRHTFAVSYLRNGGNLFYLSKILGHTTVKTTERYLQSVQVADLQAVHDRMSVLSRR